MTLEEECRLSYCRDTAPLCEDGHVMLVQHAETGRIFVKKELEVYDAQVFRYLRDHHIRHTPVIYEVLEADGKLFLIEEFISGETLRQMQERGKVFSEAEVRGYAEALCRILQELHAQVPPVIHRDIKPSNIMITPEGELKLLDMNAAKHFREGGRDTQLIGTRGYAAPEQYGFGASDIRTDIYSVGVLMNVLLTGHFPYEQQVEGSFAPVIARCVRMDPAERFSSAEELLSELIYPGKPRWKRGFRISQGHAAPAEEQSGEKYPGFRKYLPPGFRSGQPWLMVLSLGGYLLLFSVVRDYYPSVETMHSRPVWQCAMAAAVLLPVWFTADYLGIRTRLGVGKVQNSLLRWAVILAFDVLLFWLVVVIAVVTDSAM